MIKITIAQMRGTLNTSVSRGVAFERWVKGVSEAYPAPSTTGSTVVSKLLVDFSHEFPEHDEVESDEGARATSEGRPVPRSMVVGVRRGNR